VAYSVYGFAYNFVSLFSSSKASSKEPDLYQILAVEWQVR
jgi:hypothetical protein